MITTKYSPLSAPIAKNAWGWGRNASLVGDCRLAMAIGMPRSAPLGLAIARHAMGILGWPIG